MDDARHRLLVSGAVAVSAALAVSVGVLLSGYGVPLSLLPACCASCLATFSSLLFHVIDAWSTYRCRRPGCDFHVRLTLTDAAENWRWQEIAAHHPHRG